MATGVSWWTMPTSVTPGGWWGISIPRTYLTDGYAALAIVTALSGNPDIYAYVWDGSTSTYRLLRGSAWSTGHADETHVFSSDLTNDQQIAVIWVHQDPRATDNASFSFELRVRRGIPLVLPTQLPGDQNYYTPYTIPITAVMDHELNQSGVIATYNGAVAQRSYGCKKSVTDQNGRVTLLDCSPGDTSFGDMLGYRMETGTPSSVMNLNYVDTGDSTYLFYDDHTGYDFAPTSSPRGIAVYAALGGTIHFKHDRNNSVYIDHGGGWRTYYLHMLDDAGHTYQKENDYVGTGYQIGNIGATGAVVPHLHFEVMTSGAFTTINGYVDPYGSSLWR